MNNNQAAIDDLAWEITKAVTNCRHEISDKKIVLMIDGNGDGHNSLSQLMRRVRTALLQNGVRPGEHSNPATQLDMQV